ncbi:unnamed protein product, partial [Cyprideis torosa]
MTYSSPLNDAGHAQPHLRQGTVCPLRQGTVCPLRQGTVSAQLPSPYDDGSYQAQIGAPKGKTIGSNCQCDAECDFRIKESFCDVGRCSCLPGFKGFTGALECSKLRIGDRCGSDLDCSLAIANSICDNSGFCACPTGFAVTRNGCEELELGSRCTESEDCSTAVANSECTGNRCVCQTDFVETADGECRGCNVDEVLFPQGASSASCYYASEDDQNWQAARDICQARGMDLVSIHNSEEESFVA